MAHLLHNGPDEPCLTLLVLDHDHAVGKHLALAADHVRELREDQESERLNARMLEKPSMFSLLINL
jgi:hypothetical protein